MSVLASGAPWAIDLGLMPSDSMDTEMQCPNWKDHSWLPYFWAILIFLFSRVVVALGLVFSREPSCRKYGHRHISASAPRNFVSGLNWRPAIAGPDHLFLGSTPDPVSVAQDFGNFRPGSGDMPFDQSGCTSNIAGKSGFEQGAVLIAVLINSSDERGFHAKISPGRIDVLTD
jgi:hypothetical protein